MLIALAAKQHQKIGHQWGIGWALQSPTASLNLFSPATCKPRPLGFETNRSRARAMNVAVDLSVRESEKLLLELKVCFAAGAPWK